MFRKTFLYIFTFIALVIPFTTMPKAAVAKDGLGLFYIPDQTFLLKTYASGGAADYTYSFGPSTAYKVFAGDFDGDGVDGIVKMLATNSSEGRKKGTFYLEQSLNDKTGPITFYMPEGINEFYSHIFAGDISTGSSNDSVLVLNEKGVLYKYRIGAKDWTKAKFLGDKVLELIKTNTVSFTSANVINNFDSNNQLVQIAEIVIYNHSDQQVYIYDYLKEKIVKSFVYGDNLYNWQIFAGDFDKDSFDEIGLYRSEKSEFHIKNDLSSGVADTVFQYGDAKKSFKNYMPIIGKWK